MTQTLFEIYLKIEPSLWVRAPVTLLLVRLFSPFTLVRLFQPKLVFFLIVERFCLDMPAMWTVAGGVDLLVLLQNEAVFTHVANKSIVDLD
jgi:hypothetical protein